MIEIGDRVVGKSTGTLTPSTVVAKMVAQYYIAVFNNQMLNECRWDALYPEWRDGIVYINKFDEPVKSCTYEEFRAGFEPKIENEKFFTSLKDDNKKVYEDFIRYQYYILPASAIIAYPEEDLEIL